jgi:hypothetical protein
MAQFTPEANGGAYYHEIAEAKEIYYVVRARRLATGKRKPKM